VIGYATRNCYSVMKEALQTHRLMSIDDPARCTYEHPLHSNIIL